MLIMVNDEQPTRTTERFTASNMRLDNTLVYSCNTFLNTTMIIYYDIFFIYIYTK